ncbi:serine/threonine-protein phosphatase [Azoarcus sp. L1K30]|uniref:PP2C family protein-serine/threonine phosphatase n=1 Tax=Azoarcus sp. L1K30 TaxID=2820277 RepID=UPI001B8202FD|nr:serine/threonine-protein phosphatase [Azoarcus sp. L1K30]
MRFTIYQESRVGKRKNNQDRIAYCYSRDALIMVLADGMGGHLHGEVAAHIAVQYLTQAFQREAQPLLEDPALFLSRSLSSAHHAILDYALDKNLPEAPRTTIVVCVVQEGYAHWAHAGDSRLYLLRHGRINTQTRDHSRVQLMLDQGLLDAEGAATHPGRNRIYSCLGGTHAPQIEFSRRTLLQDGDIIALCSDGVWGPVGDQGLLLGLTTTNLLEAVPKLMTRAEELAGASCDNLSLVTMCWHDDIGAAVPDSVSTQTMALHDFTTQMDAFQRTTRGSATAVDLSDDEIERAIAEINSAIKKFTK